MYGNLSKNSNYIFSSTTSGVNIYDTNLFYIGNLSLDSVSSIYANESTLFIGTTNSGIFYYDLSLIASGAYTDIFSYKQAPAVTGNIINYLHGAGDYLIVTTESGIDQYNILTDDRLFIYSTKSLSKCFQTTSGSFYYVSSEIEDTFINRGVYKSTIRLTNRNPLPDIQIKIVLNTDNFDYSKVFNDGRDILFFDQYQNELSFFIEEWVLNGTSTIWVKLPVIGTEYLYIVYGDFSATSSSNPSATFDLYDDFDYPLLEVGTTNYFSLSYGNITASGTPYVERLYDGNNSNYYFYSFPNEGDYFQIEFFVPTIIGKVLIYISGYSFSVPIYIYGSNSGEFSGEETLLCHKAAASSSPFSILLFNTTAYLYYRVSRGAGINAWQISEVLMLETTYPDITTISGSPWVYTSDYSKFASTQSSTLTCKNSNNDYIRTDYNFSVPLVIEQYIKLDDGLSGEIAYASTVAPDVDGIGWYPAGTPTFSIIIGGVSVSTLYDLQQALSTTWSLLQVVILQSMIKITITVNGSVYVASWGASVHSGDNKAIQIFMSAFKSDVSIDWVRVRKYNINAPEVLGISTPIKLGSTYYLNVVYNNLVDWESESNIYCYYPGDNIVINDIFITENTSLYAPNNNVIFMATTDGAIIIEERRGEESTSRIKYIKA